MKTFKQFLADAEDYEEAILQRVQLFEQETYRLIPSSNNSYRTDAGNTNTKTMKHSHVYARPKGRGSELYSVNIDGSGHDGSSGMLIPSSHADFFRSLGYDINSGNILESIGFADVDEKTFTLILLENA